MAVSKSDLQHLVDQHLYEIQAEGYFSEARVVDVDDGPFTIPYVHVEMPYAILFRHGDQVLSYEIECDPFRDSRPEVWPLIQRYVNWAVRECEESNAPTVQQAAEAMALRDAGGA